ncbi:TetR family transcriptional regulator [Aquibacillus halophilus]|uniref:TetR family transcriptional regulator n=1 Tax=Aquibacillus halophilus TaxID=930132 RepID=A0A6A8D893_9BACI|nr:TetR/AcrR family transcriptional regulator [Aquibacillus halophilus]MRH41490.1 TetR family transcriptional regulator [Aquibacillus halophilus]
MKEKILVTCIQLFEHKGFSETSIQDIVDSLAVTKGTFYYYFKSKEEVLMVIHRMYIDTLLEQQNKLLEDGALTNKDRLRGLVEMLVTNITPLGKSARVFHRELRHLSEDHMKEARAKRDQVRVAIEKVIVAGMENGEFRPDVKADIVTLGILGACNWSYQWFKPEGKYSDLEVSEVFIDMVCQGITPK